MALELKAKDVRNSYNCFSLGYCELYNILNVHNRIGYTCGIYGWNANVYVDMTSESNVAIVTGYRPFGRQIPQAILDKYRKADKELQNIVSVGERIDTAKRLYNELIAELWAIDRN